LAFAFLLLCRGLRTLHRFDAVRACGLKYTLADKHPEIFAAAMLRSSIDARGCRPLNSGAWPLIWIKMNSNAARSLFFA